MEFVRVSVSYMRKTASQIDSTIQNLLLHVVLTGQMCQRFGFQIRSSFDGMYTMSLSLNTQYSVLLSEQQERIAYGRRVMRKTSISKSVQQFYGATSC